jgi:glucose/arabinose dehydrogenase
VLPGFSDSLVTSLSSPTALAFTPDGRMLITTQGGQLRVHQNNVLVATPAVVFGANGSWGASSRLCSGSERGLLGVAVDPEFVSNSYIYLFYTFRKPVTGHCNSSGGADTTTDPNYPVNRVSRFTLSGNVVLTGTETVLVDNMPSPNGNHNGGDLNFGQDGYLYISIGDGGCDYAGGGCAGSNNAARDEHVLTGKILRVTRDGGIPPGNPFTGSDSDRCNVAGKTTAGRKCQETFAWGLRNPFRFAFDPTFAGTRFLINDVGQGTWEEIDLGAPGADYGWNVREGHCANGSTSNCGAPPAGMTNPIFDYRHGSGNNVPGTNVSNCNSITGGAFVPNGIGWPAAYTGAYLFSDYVCGAIFRINPSGPGFTATTAYTLAASLGGSSAVHLRFGPYGFTQALYYTTYANGGEVRRISFANAAPTAVASADPLFGASAPLTVTFSALGSTDPDGNPLTFDWDFGDTLTTTTSSITTTHTYTQTGIFTATLVARDTVGSTSLPATVQVQVGNTPPAAAITAPDSGMQFYVGQVITTTGVATDTQPTVLNWEVRQWHIYGTSVHYHPWHSATNTASTSFAAPAPEDLSATDLSYLEVRLTATDAWGLATTVTRTLEPNRVTVTFVTSPPGLRLNVNERTITATASLTSWQNFDLAINGPGQNNGSGWWLFPPDKLPTPASAITYTAVFLPAQVTFMPIIGR